MDPTTIGPVTIYLREVGGERRVIAALEAMKRAVRASDAALRGLRPATDGPRRERGVTLPSGIAMRLVSLNP